MLVTEQEIQQLLMFYKEHYYTTIYKTPTAQAVMKKCADLFEMDYKIKILHNDKGTYCSNYPPQLILIDSELHSDVPRTAAQDTVGNVQRFRQLISGCHFARCRSRFPMPVLLVQGKYICRSATLSGAKEVYGSRLLWYGGGGDAEDEDGDVMSYELTEQVRKKDIKLLQAMDVNIIVDLMVENKKVKYGLNVSSSEKVDKGHRYDCFNLLPLPYPGCEFFKEYWGNNYSGKGLHFDWNQSFIDAMLVVPVSETTNALNIGWENYKSWDLIQLTQNYLKLILAYIQNEDSGILVHCISGWDRTPLFISILRLSLWADGEIHKNLSAEDVLYLTLAYDWMLFSHQLDVRVAKGEEILHFCFNFLKFIVGNEYAVKFDRKQETKENVPDPDPEAKQSPSREPLKLKHLVIPFASPRRLTESQITNLEGGSKTKSSPSKRKSVLNIDYDYDGYIPSIRQIKDDEASERLKVTLASDAYRYMYRSPPSQGNKTDAKEWDFVSSEEVMTEALKNDDVFEQEVRNMNIPELPPINYKLPVPDPSQPQLHPMNPFKIMLDINEAINDDPSIVKESKVGKETETATTANLVQKLKTDDNIEIDKNVDNEYKSKERDLQIKMDIEDAMKELPQKKLDQDSKEADWNLLPEPNDTPRVSAAISDVSEGGLKSVVLESQHVYGRKEKLLRVREIFLKNYATAVGLKYIDGSDRSLYCKISEKFF